MLIKANDSRIRYTGRIDWLVETEPVWVFPCTSAEFVFTGNKLTLLLKNRCAYWQNYIGVIIDGTQQCYYLKEGENRINISLPQNDINEHRVMIFKRQDSCHEVTILGFEIEDDADLLQCPKAPALKMEVYGDSVSAGEVSEAIDYTGKEDPLHDGGYSNSWYSYSWMTARKLGAQLHDIAQGGIALMDQTGWFMEPDAVGMDTAWDKIHYNPAFDNTMNWDFSLYIPDIVVVAVGQNDAHPYDFMKEDYNSQQSVKWRARYKSFLQRLRSVYPDAYIICATTLLEHDAAWDRAIADVVSEMKDSKITHYLYRRNGAATPGHPRITEAYEMAEELSAYIQELMQ